MKIYSMSEDGIRKRHYKGKKKKKKKKKTKGVKDRLHKMHNTV